MIPFTEDQWWRVTNNLHVTTHSLKYLEKVHPRIDDDERERMVKAIKEFEQFSYKLYDKFGDQFHHRPDARSVCRILTVKVSTHISGAIGIIAPNAEQSLRKQVNSGRESDIYGN